MTDPVATWIGIGFTILSAAVVCVIWLLGTIGKSKHDLRGEIHIQIAQLERDIELVEARTAAQLHDIKARIDRMEERYSPGRGHAD